ncbi:MAG: sulfate adenylyltransferase [Chloroflexi bacterium]|nr:sulfate adenylyltransferase [Chloroflexota bacterium]
MKGVVVPHGGKLVSRLVPAEVQGVLQERALSLKKVRLTPRAVCDLEMIAIGAFSPLEGFMGHVDYQSVVNHMHLANGLPWTIPITLSAEAEEARWLKEGEDVALVDIADKVLAILHLEEKYDYDKEWEAEQVYRTTDEEHPGVVTLYNQGEGLLGGKVSVLEIPRHDFLAYRLNPVETRRIFAERGWKRVVGFQTRNPIHRAHEYIQKCALEIVDGLFIHPLVGETKDDDIPAWLRMKCYEVLVENYYPRDRVVMAVMPAAMRYAGPREAILHALVRKNYGCSHFIVGRDHAGVGNYYGTYDAHYVFDEFEEEELGVVPLFFEHAFYCRRCGNMASPKTCPHEADDRIILSGTKVRAMLQQGEEPPPEFTRPEVAQILVEGMKSRQPSYSI